MYHICKKNISYSRYMYMIFMDEKKIHACYDLILNSEFSLKMC